MQRREVQELARLAERLQETDHLAKGSEGTRAVEAGHEGTGLFPGPHQAGAGRRAAGGRPGGGNARAALGGALAGKTWETREQREQH